MNDFIDQPTSIRSGEELDTAQLEKYLRDHFGDAPGILQVHQFPGGHSNLTYLVTLGDRKLILRRPPLGSKVRSAHDMGREFRVLSKLRAVYPPAPEVILYCEDNGVLGVPFYVMKPIEGIILRNRLPPGMDLTCQTVRRLSEVFLDNLVALHHVDYAAAGLGDLGKPQGYIERQVRGWVERYYGSKTHEYPEVEKLAAWMPHHLPATSRTTLIHNDYKYDNVVLDPIDMTRIKGVLDWEMCTIGDPLADLGTTLAYWFDADDPTAVQLDSSGPTALPGSFTREELLQRYAQKTGADVAYIAFYLTFARFKLAVILQQIYFRYHQGITRDARFAAMPAAIQSLLQSALECAQTGRI